MLMTSKSINFELSPILRKYAHVFHDEDTNDFKLTRRLIFLLAATHHDVQDKITIKYTNVLLKVVIYYDAAHLYRPTR